MGLRALRFAFLPLTPTYALSLPPGRPVIKAAASAASKAVTTAGQAVQRAPRLAAASFALGVGVGVAASSVQTRWSSTLRPTTSRAASSAAAA